MRQRLLAHQVHMTSPAKLLGTGTPTSVLRAHQLDGEDIQRRSHIKDSSCSRTTRIATS